jgi:hypothetical protein
MDKPYAYAHEYLRGAMEAEKENMCEALMTVLTRQFKHAARNDPYTDHVFFYLDDQPELKGMSGWALQRVARESFHGMDVEVHDPEREDMSWSMRVTLRQSHGHR